ncbi:hypothetical protein [Bradyrhizobium sp. STM 3557]|uniref:hypothetical protein n=1 Tax=Bradyrhizobium sp. STM 3557 TaxID=578920 RepID=UPI00388EDDF4
MTDSINATADIAAADIAATEEPKRFRSELSFPYADLESCVELAQTLFARVGSSACDQGELAAWMNQSATGGTFRTRISAAKMFGLIDTGQGRASITQLGRDALTGSGAERGARVQAFLSPELFSRMYEQSKGHILPPPAAIERQMEQMGISPRQKERARQTFVKSATYAGFIDASTGRFVKPGLSPQEERAPARDDDLGNGNGAGGGNQPPIDPIIAGLLARLPRSGEVWPEAERALWLQLLEGSFKLIYKDRPSG